MDEKIYTLSEFRKCTREAFNLADDLVDVYIDRYGVRYMLITESYYKEILKSVETTKKVPSIKESSGFCKDGHPIPEGRSRCMGKGCKHS